MLKKCHLCIESIVQAKDRQAAEANKNASILLEELDLEKVRNSIAEKLVRWWFRVVQGVRNELLYGAC